MLTPVDFAIWASGFVLYICVTAITIRNREFLRYLALNTYVLATAASTAGEWLVYAKYGYSSAQYMYFYYYSESFLSILLYLVVCGFYSELMDSIGAGRAVRLATLLITGATALTAFSVVETHRDHLNSRFVVELGRDLNFVGGLLTYTLLLALAKVSTPSRRWTQLVSALGFYFFGLALIYGIRMIYPEWQFLHDVLPLTGLWIAMAWIYTFVRVPATEKVPEKVISVMHQQPSLS